MCTIDRPVYLDIYPTFLLDFHHIIYLVYSRYDLDLMYQHLLSFTFHFLCTLDSRGILYRKSSFVLLLPALK
jgi:hypothetical protein